MLNETKNVDAKDRKALAQWYRDLLGLEVQSCGGAALPFDTPGHPPKVSWTAFPDSSDYMSPSAREFMINFAVDDMDTIVARLLVDAVPRSPEREASVTRPTFSEMIARCGNRPL